MTMLTGVYLLTFIPVIIFTLILWSDVRAKKQFGKRPLHLLSSIILLGAIGLAGLTTALLPSVFTPDSSFGLFSLFFVLYLVAFFLAEYSVHSQRLVRSFFMEDFRKRCKGYFIFLGFLALIAGLALAVFFVCRPGAGVTEPALAINTALLVIFALLSLIFLLTAGRRLFYFPAGIIRQNLIFLVASSVTLSAYLIAFLYHGFLESVPLWLFTVNNCLYLARVTHEYFYQRTLNLDRTLGKYEETLHLKNDLIAKVVNSSGEEDIAIIRASVSGELDRARAFMPAPEHGVNGTIIYTREGNQLKVCSSEHIDGFCVPIARLETMRLYKNKDQFDEIILRTPFAVNTILATPRELLPSWGERLLKEALETKQPVVTTEIPGELKGLHSLVALYPVFDKDYLAGLIVVFKDAFPKLFPEEENALEAIVDNLTVIFSIIKGKQIQRERNRLQGELEIAKQIQTSILPKKIVIDGCECAAVMTTASEVGGDVYDLFQSPYGAYLGIGDVSGHGLPAGITALIQLTAFHSAVLTAAVFEKRLEPHELYEIVNRVLCEINKNRIGSDKFMTGNYLLIRDGRFAYAGTHLIALKYVKSDNAVVELERLANRTAFMGISPAISAKDSAGEFSLNPQDLLLLYTDGIIEAKDNYSHQFGIQRLKELLAASVTLPPEEIVNYILKAVHEHAKNGDLKRYKGNLADDATLLLIRKL